MIVRLRPYGLFVVFREAMQDRHALGFKIKPASQMSFSQRNGFERGMRLGPLWIGTYAQRTPTTHHPHNHATRG